MAFPNWQHANRKMYQPMQMPLRLLSQAPLVPDTIHGGEGRADDTRGRGPARACNCHRPSRPCPGSQRISSARGAPGDGAKPGRTGRTQAVQRRGGVGEGESPPLVPPPAPAPLGGMAVEVGRAEVEGSRAVAVAPPLA